MGRRLTDAERRERAVARWIKAHGVTTGPPSHDEEGVMRRRRSRAKRVPKHHESTATRKRVAGRSGGNSNMGTENTEMGKSNLYIQTRSRARIRLSDGTVVYRKAWDVSGAGAKRKAVGFVEGAWFHLSMDDDGRTFKMGRKASAPEGAEVSVLPPKRKAVANAKPKAKAKAAAKPKAKAKRKQPAKKAASKSGSRKAA